MSFLDVVAAILGVVVGCEAVKRYAKDYVPDDFFYEPKHLKKSTVRKWLERAAFLILGGE